MNNIKKLVAVVLVGLSVGTVIPIQANAEWKQDNTGWWYAKESGGYYKNEWLKFGKKWYHFDDNGYIQANVKVDGFQLDSEGEYEGEKQKRVTELKNKDLDGLPNVNRDGISISVKTMNDDFFNDKSDIKLHYLDSNGNTVYLYKTNRAKFNGSKKINESYYADNPLYEYVPGKFDEHDPCSGTDWLDVAGKVDTVLYKDVNGNVLYKARVKNDKLYFYDKEDKPLCNTIVNSKVTDSEGAWKIGNIRSRLSKPINKPDFKLNVYPEQFDQIHLNVENSNITPENITFTLENNYSDINNNIGQIKFKDGWKVYKLSDDKKQWINMFNDCGEDSSILEEYTLGYRNSYSFWFNPSSNVYNKAFSKPGTYLIISDGLELAEIVNVQ